MIDWAIGLVNCGPVIKRVWPEKTVGLALDSVQAAVVAFASSLHTRGGRLIEGGAYQVGFTLDNRFYQ